MANHPIDLFFNSLSVSRKENGIALVLSGTGTDGTLGSMAIVGSGGTLLVQDPDTTRFDGMPKSVISAGQYTLVAPPGLLAKNVIKTLEGNPLVKPTKEDRVAELNPFDDLLSMMKHEYGTDFFQYKDTTVTRRLERRARIKGIEDLSRYRDYVRRNPSELPELYADLLIEVTSFFRDADAFELLKTKVIPTLIASKQPGEAVRVWVPGCASGEEAYSIAILLQEHARLTKTPVRIKILATDIHIRSMSQASSGTYPISAVQHLPDELVSRYFDVRDGQAQIKSVLRNMVFFSTHDLMKDPPFTRIDLVSCRNLLIYLINESQEKVMGLLHFSMCKDGVLFLGPSEQIGSISHEFEPISEKWRLYRKLRDVKLLPIDSIFQRGETPAFVRKRRDIPPAAPRAISTGLTGPSMSIKRAQNTALETIISRYAPPGFLVSDQGAIAHIFGDAGDLLPIRSGEFSYQLTDLIRPDLKAIVISILDIGRQPEFTKISRTVQIEQDDNKFDSYQLSLENVLVEDDQVKYQLLFRF